MERYSDQVMSVINRNTLVSLAHAQGFTAFLPVCEDGIDLILHRESDQALRKVLIQGCWTIDRTYLGRGIWIAFLTRGGNWYLMPHDEMVAVEEANGIARHHSWREKGRHEALEPGIRQMAAARPYQLESPVDVVVIKFNAED